MTLLHLTKNPTVNRQVNISDHTATAIKKVRKLFLPAWCLPNGTIKATENQLESASSSCERWAIWCGALVVVSVIAELVIAWAAPPYNSFLAYSAITDAAIAIGIVGEVGFGMWNSRIQTELRSRSNAKLGEAVKAAGDANDRAAKAELETEKLRIAASWRSLSKEQYESLALALRTGGPGASLRICVLMNDQESLAFAHSIAIPFRAARWAVGYRFESYTHNIMTGLMLPEPRDNWLEEMKVVNGRVRDAFISAEISFVNGWPLEPYQFAEDNTPLSAPIAWLYVGPKPPPRV